tara:strand:+ start:1203 stop:1784 length:582 start_codon:yes stop_codon:yes gene_type:complete
MSDQSRILVFAGSARRESFNRKLAAHAYRMILEKGGSATLLDAAGIHLPLYHGDLEEAEGLPEEVHRLKQVFNAHDAFLIASPEYNSSVTPFLKNLIDWISRPTEGEESLAQFSGKVAGLLSASPGALGGMRGLVHLRDILGNIGVTVIPEERAVPHAYEAFDEEGNLTDERASKAVANVVDRLIAVAAKLAG